jgi:5-(carboxyamino)imidazole ribonucleotide mutase
MAKVGVIIGSKTDEPLIQPALDTLTQLGIDYDYSILSAHRSPDKVREYGLKARDKGIEVIIAAAGAAAHLPGALAAWTTLPVMPTSELKGVDSLYSIVQMPSGVPVACMSVGTSGAKNAALFAAQILGLKYKDIADSFEKYKSEKV